MKQALRFFAMVATVLVSISAMAQAPAAPAAPGGGFELKDPSRGFAFVTPNSSWSVNANQYSITLIHGTYFDAMVNLRKSWFTVASVQEAYDKKKQGLTSSLPGAQMVKESEAINIGNIPALSMTYKDPAQQKIHREIVLLNKGVPYELTFSVKEENFEKVKGDFSSILSGIQSLP